MKLLIILSLVVTNALCMPQSALDALIDEAVGPSETPTEPEPVQKQPKTPAKDDQDAAASGGPPSAADEQVITERQGYLPPPPPAYPECGIEYDCVSPLNCDIYGNIDIGGSLVLDLRQTGDLEQELEARFGGQYYGGFTQIPNKKCTLPDGYEGQCCRLPPVDVCPQKGGECFPGWHCPNWDGSRYPDIFSIPRTCISSTSPNSICCGPRSFFPPTPKTCGVRNPDGIYPNLPIGHLNVDKRILDRKSETEFAEFPWQGLVYIHAGDAGYQFLSGAVLISTRHLLTAAHNVANKIRGNPPFQTIDPYKLQVRLGEYEVNTLNEPIEHQDYFVDKIYVHPGYVPGPEHNDLAILELNKEVYITNNVHVACMPPSPNSKYDDSRCVATGWGKDAFEGLYQQVMKRVDLPMVSNYECEKALRTTRLTRHFQLHPNFVCAGGEPGADACTGDGGGPLVCPIEGRWTLVGITAWGIGCGTPGIPGVYAGVAPALPWIEEVLSQAPHRTFPPYLLPGQPGYRAKDGDADGSNLDSADFQALLEASDAAAALGGGPK